MNSGRGRHDSDSDNSPPRQSSDSSSDSDSGRSFKWMSVVLRFSVDHWACLYSSISFVCWASKAKEQRNYSHLNSYSQMLRPHESEHSQKHLESSVKNHDPQRRRLKRRRRRRRFIKLSKGLLINDHRKAPSLNFCHPPTNILFPFSGQGIVLWIRFVR